jgi:hypothetical protein
MIVCTMLFRNTGILGAALRSTFCNPRAQANQLRRLNAPEIPSTGEPMY